MTTTDWHVPGDLLADFARAPAQVDPVAAASTEAHLLVCARCRATVATEAPPELLAASWAEVADRIDAPRRHPLERVLGVLGVRPTAARLVSATPALSLAWLLAVVAVTALAVAAAHQGDTDAVFVAVAPLLPLAAVAITFATGGDPAGEAGLATPLAGAGLVLRRATAVAAATLVCLAAGAVALPAVGATAFAWVLPSLALASGALALGTWRPVEQAAAALAGLWALAVAVVAVVAALGGPSTPSLVGPPTQLVAMAGTAAAVAVLAVRRDHLTLRGVRP